MVTHIKKIWKKLNKQNSKINTCILQNITNLNIFSPVADIDISGIHKLLVINFSTTWVMISEAAEVDVELIVYTNSDDLEFCLKAEEQNNAPIFIEITDENN